MSSSEQPIRRSRSFCQSDSGWCGTAEGGTSMPRFDHIDGFVPPPLASRSRRISWLMIGIGAIALILGAFRAGPFLGFIGLVVLLLSMAFRPASDRLLGGAALATLLYPFVYLAAAHLVWLAAWGWLGQPPRAHLDDPSGLSEFFRVSQWMLALGMSVVVLMGCAAGAIMMTQVWKFGIRLLWERPQVLGVALVGLLAGLAAIVYMRADPLGLFGWLFD